MKITFVLPYAGLAGGIRVVAIYAKKLQERGHYVTIVSQPKREIPLKQKIKNLIKEKRWPKLDTESSHFDRLDINHRILGSARSVTDDDIPDADAVIATWWETAEWVYNLSQNKGVKYYFVQGHETHKHLPVDRVKATYRLPMKKITIAQWLKDILEKKYGDTDVSIVPNSVNHKIFFCAETRKMQNHKTIGFMYSPSYVKGCDLTIEAIKLVQKKYSKIKILSFGPVKVSDALPLPENTEYFHQPTQDKIREIYSSCDFWLFGSRAEGFGLPILEAMACGTPVIATPTGAAPDFIDDGTGVLLEGYNEHTIASGIEKALKMSEDKWLKMSINSQHRVSFYSWDDATDLFEQVLLKGLNKNEN